MEKIDLDEILEQLEAERREAIYNAKKAACVIMLIALVIGILLHTFYKTGGLATLIIGGLVSYGVYRDALGKVAINFKMQVLPSLLEGIDPSLTYDINGYIEEDEFNDTQLFHRPDQYWGSDLVMGQIGQTKFSFSRVDAQEKKQRTTIDDNGRSITETTMVTYFGGLLFVADFNKQFAGRTLVKSEALNIFSKVFGSPVVLEDPRFNDIFTVNSTDQLEARYIMTPSMMEKFTLLHTKAGKFRASFSHGRLYIALDVAEDFLEPSMKQSLKDSQQIKKIVDHLRIVTGIVEDLGLNTRIWSVKTIG